MAKSCGGCASWRGAALSSEQLRVLHLISRLDDRRAWAAAAAGPGVAGVVLLLHDAVMETRESVAGYVAALGHGQGSSTQVLASARDAQRRGVGDRWRTIDYREMVKLMAEADRVISW